MWFPQSHGWETLESWLVVGANYTTEEWAFYVLPKDAIEAWPAQSLRPSTVTAGGYPVIDRIQLAETIRAITG